MGFCRSFMCNMYHASVACTRGEEEREDYPFCSTKGLDAEHDRSEPEKKITYKLVRIIKTYFNELVNT